MSIDDTDNVNSSLASYTRVAGETVLGGPYAILSATFNPLTGSAANNYNAPVGYSGSPVLTITPATLNASLQGNVLKIYDATINATLSAANYSLTGIVGTDDVSITNTDGTYNNKNVGTGKTVIVPLLTLTGSDASNYVLSSTTISGAVGSIQPATLTVSGVLAENKLFDANTKAILNINSANLSGVFSGDTVNVSNSGYNANFSSAAVGNNIPVTVANLGLTGDSSNNYVLIQPTSITANILPTESFNTNVSFGVVFPTYFNSPNEDVITLQPTLFTKRIIAEKDFVKEIKNGCADIAPGISICGNSKSE